MTTLAPASLYAVYNGITLPTKILSGIKGDTAHQQRGGYHISREDQTSRSNYSITMRRDQGGPDNDAAALDVGFGDRAENTLMGERLRYAMANDDPRVDCIREIYYWNPDRGGTCGYDHPTHGPAQTGQDHSGHVHISFHRDVVSDLDAIRGVIEVCNGTGHATSGGINNPIPSEEDDMPFTEQELRTIVSEEVDRAVRNLAAPKNADGKEGELFGRFRQATALTFTGLFSGPGKVGFDRLRQAVGVVMDRRDQAAAAQQSADAAQAELEHTS